MAASAIYAVHQTHQIFRYLHVLKKKKNTGNDCNGVCKITFVRVHIPTLLSHVCVSFSFLSWLMRCVCLRVLPRCREDEEPPAIVRVCLCCLRCSLVVKDWKGDDPIFGSSHTLVTPADPSLLH